MNNQEIAAVVEAIEDELAQSAIGLSSVGLHAQFQGIRTGRMTDDSGSSRTEATISIHEGESVIDILEFFVAEDRMPIVSPTEVRDWLRNELEKIVQDHPLGGGWMEVS